MEIGKFKIQGSDKRKEFIAKSLEETQKLHGKDVEHFSLETGFILLDKEAPIKYKTVSTQRALAAAKLSMGVPLELREFYYTLGATPELAKAFATCKAKDVYVQVLQAIKNVEMLCDIGRENFCIGNMSKGFIYYHHSENYGDKDRKVAFTEKIARSVLAEEELEACENIIVVEKMAAANRLVDLGFSELTNSVIVTVGGNFSRAIWELTKRFNGRKNLLFFADGDVYGVDMLRTIAVGTKSSRHLDYKFLPSLNPKIYLTGLYPSIGESLGLPNDKEQKRPSQRPATRQRIQFLQRYGLVDSRDVETWLGKDKTYELESLSTHFKNNEGKPAGLAIYLVEYMRLHNIPVKPPLPSDEELEKDFRKAALEELKREIGEKVSLPKWFWDLYWKLDKWKGRIAEEVYENLVPEYDKALDRITAKEIKYHIYKQFEENPEKAQYDLAVIAHKIKRKFDIEVDWDLDDLEDVIKVKVEDYLGPAAKEDVIFEAIHNDENYDKGGYDLVLRRLGADMEDAYKIREALRRRFNK